MIYYVEDDKNIRELVVYTLNQSGLPAAGFSTAEEFWENAQKEQPQLVLLDIMLPNEDGLSILKRLRQSAAYEAVPVIMVTAQGSEYNRVIGLDSGADDYITKPFSMMELVARVKAVLRRIAPKDQTDEIKTGSIVMNIKKHTVMTNGLAVTLTFKEFELLRTLMEHKGIVFSREHLLNTVWGYDFEGGTRTVDVHVQTLRQKLGDSAELIETVRGVGYRIGG
ncbi:MAG: winged helix-turn-helix domain-containing protein [Christensenellales bacterium]